MSRFNQSHLAATAAWLLATPGTLASLAVLSCAGTSGIDGAGKPALPGSRSQLQASALVRALPSGISVRMAGPPLQHLALPAAAARVDGTGVNCKRDETGGAESCLFTAPRAHAMFTSMQSPADDFCRTMYRIRGTLKKGLPAYRGNQASAAAVCQSRAPGPLHQFVSHE